MTPQPPPNRRLPPCTLRTRRRPRPATPPGRWHGGGLAAAALAAGLLAGCAGNPIPADPNAAPVVTRSPGSTVWATPEAEAAATARRAGARRPATAAAAAPPAPAPAVAAAASAPAAAPAAPAPADVAAPLQRLVFFDFDSFDIHPDFQAMLEGHALALKADPARQLIVEGHADDRGGAEYNLALGQKRAEAVVKALRLMGARDNQLEAVSFGDTRPVDPARTFEAWAKNRRAELRER